MTWSKVDGNQAEIVYALRRAGCSVEPIHMVRHGVPDLLIGITRGLRRINLLLEVKNSDLPPSKQRLTPDEERWHQKWRGQVAVVKSAQEAIDLVSQYRREA